MVNIRSFPVWRPAPENVARIHAVPYDVVNRAEAAALAAGNPLSFLHVSRAEIDLPEHVDAYSQEVYQKARANLLDLRQNGPYLYDDEPALYVYAQEIDGHKQFGVVAAVSVDDYDSGKIKRHENTRIDKENDRTNHALALGAHTGLVFLIHRDQQEIDDIVSATCSQAPVYDVIDEEGVRHQVWKCSGAHSTRLEQIFAETDNLYIADGHHRAKSASRVRETLKERGQLTPEHPANRFPAVIFPASQLRILPYNRAVRDLNGLSREEFLHRVAESFDITSDVGACPEAPEHIHLYMAGRWYGLKLKHPPSTERVSETLDVAILQQYLLDPILGIENPRTDERITFIGGSRGTGELVKMVDSGAWQIAFSMYPTTVEQLLAVSDQNDLMPPKSTWFYPKLRDGFFIYQFLDD